jgi:antitoxin component of RelBE/YafQ-DinJ toxin-antitoxin module
MIHAWTESGLKAEAETILRSLGLSYTDAINLFLNQVQGVCPMDGEKLKSLLVERGKVRL